MGDVAEASVASPMSHAPEEISGHLIPTCPDLPPICPDLVVSSSVPPKTRDEVAAQRLIRCAAGKLRQIAMVLRGARHSLPKAYTADEAEAMGEHRALYDMIERKGG